MFPRKYDIDDIFDHFLIPSHNSNMKCDIYEKDDKCNIIIDAPGFNKEDIKIELEQGYLKISAEKTSESKDDDKNYIRRERIYGKFERSFYVGNISMEDIKANFNQGVLTISLPNKEQKENKSYIEIE